MAAKKSPGRLVVALSLGGLVGNGGAVLSLANFALLPLDSAYMPLEESHLTDTERHRVREYRQQGLTLAAIAKEVGCSVSKVWRYLRSLNGLPSLTIPTVPITDSQYRLIIIFEQSGLSSQDVATRLEIDVNILRRELAGTKSMSTQRIGAIKKILGENTQDK